MDFGEKIEETTAANQKPNQSIVGCSSPSHSLSYADWSGHLEQVVSQRHPIFAGRHSFSTLSLIHVMSNVSLTSTAYDMSTSLHLRTWWLPEISKWWRYGAIISMKSLYDQDVNSFLNFSEHDIKWCFQISSASY